MRRMKCSCSCRNDDESAVHRVRGRARNGDAETARTPAAIIFTNDVLFMPE